MVGNGVEKNYRFGCLAHEREPSEGLLVDFTISWEGKDFLVIVLWY